MRGAEGGAQGLITVDDSESYFNEPNAIFNLWKLK